MKVNDKLNMVAAIQKNLRVMQQQAQIYIDKHHTNLPPLCSVRHYLFHSLGKKNTIDVVNTQRRTSQDMIQKQKSPPINHKATVYNVEFRKKICSEQAQLNYNSKSLLNSTSMRMKINGGWRSIKNNDSKNDKLAFLRDKSDDKMKTIVMNSQIVDFSDRDLTSNYTAFSPKIGKIDLSKKQAEMLNRYINRFKEPKQKQQKKQKVLRKRKKSISKLNKLNEKSKEYISQDLIQNVQPIKKRRKLSIRYETIQDPQKQLILVKKKSRMNMNRPSRKKKQEVDLDYTPWQSGQINHNNIDQYMSSAIF